MNTIKRTWNRTSIFKFLSLGLIVLGSMFICWSVFHIMTQTVDPVEKGQADDIQWTAKNAANHQALTYAEPSIAGDKIGILSIPALNQNWPIIEGTEAEQLAKGVGHFSQSVFPGISDNCVLSGHRDTVFSEIGNLKIEDKLIVETSAGIFTYEISNIRIVDKDDKTVIVPTDHAVLTITTCYPFHFVGSAPERYILVADLVNID